MEASNVDNFAEQAQAEALQAIAYKLDEISKNQEKEAPTKILLLEGIYAYLQEISKKLDKSDDEKLLASVIKGRAAYEEKLMKKKKA